MWPNWQQKNSSFKHNNIGGGQGHTGDNWDTHTLGSQHENALRGDSENKQSQQTLWVLGPDGGLEVQHEWGMKQHDPVEGRARVSRGVQ